MHKPAQGAARRERRRRIVAVLHRRTLERERIGAAIGGRNQRALVDRRRNRRARYHIHPIVGDPHPQTPPPNPQVAVRRPCLDRGGQAHPPPRPRPTPTPPPHLPLHP